MVWQPIFWQTYPQKNLASSNFSRWFTIWSETHSTATQFGNTSPSKASCCTDENILQSLQVERLRLVTFKPAEDRGMLCRTYAWQRCFYPELSGARAKIRDRRDWRDCSEQCWVVEPAPAHRLHWWFKTLLSRNLLIAIYHRPLRSCVPGASLDWRCVLRPHWTLLVKDPAPDLPRHKRPVILFFQACTKGFLHQQMDSSPHPSPNP